MNKMYSCHVCLQSFSTERKVELHIMQSHRKPSLEKKTVTLDEVCGKTQEDFCTKRAFQEHGKQHQETSFICEMCPAVWKFGPDNIFPTKQKLSKHVFEFHKSNTTCSVCDKTFSQYSNLKRHEKIHSDGMTCKNCNKTFLLKEYVSKHEKKCQFKTFTKELKNEEKFSCHVCTNCYASNSSLIKHLKTTEEMTR